MSNNDEFDVDIDETVEDSFDEVTLDEETAAEEAPVKKKKSGGGLVSVIALLAVLGGGGYAAVKYLGVELPFDIPGVTQNTAKAPAGQPPSSITATADLPQDSLPPQPDVSGTTDFDADMVARTGTSAPDSSSVLPDLGLPSEHDQDASINPPWDAGDTNTAASSDAPTGNSADIVDPFALSAQDVTDAVNNPDSTVTAPAETAAAETPAAEVVDPFAAEPVETPAAETPAAETSAPANEFAAQETVTPAPAAADPAQAARVAELEKKVAALEKSLADADKALKKANDDLASTQKQLSERTDALSKAQADAKAAKTAPKAESKTETAVGAPAKTESTAKAESKPAAQKAPAPAVRKSWVLRSAKPGVALVSEKGSNEMRTVSVGDTLSGIGKVTAITTDAQGRWVVKGTRGSIQQ